LDNINNIDPNALFRYSENTSIYRIYAFIINIPEETINITSLLFTICYYDKSFPNIFFSDVIAIPFKSSGNRWLKLDDMLKLDSIGRFTVALPKSDLGNDGGINILHNNIMSTDYANNNPIVYSGMIELDLKNQRYESILLEIEMYLHPVSKILNVLIIKSEDEQRRYEVEADNFISSMSEFFEKSKIILSSKGGRNESK